MANILCIDIGGTRIKSALLNDEITIEELKNTNVKTMETLGWMNSSLPQIMCKNHPASLIHDNENLGHYNSIAIGVPLKVVDNGKIVEGHYIKFGVPKNLFEAFKEKAHCDIVITNDGRAWIHGILEYFQLCSIEIEFPCLAVVLGTGVGLAYSDSYTKIKGLEFSHHNHNFKHLSTIINEDIHDGSRIHDLLGKRFFHDIEDKYKTWTYLEIQNEYTERLLCLFKDMEEANLYNFKNVKSIMIAGGNSKYLSLSSLKSSINKSTYILDKNFLQLNPDLISLLGLVSLANKNTAKDK